MPSGVVIDGDILVYRCGFAAQRTVYHVTTEEGGAGHHLGSFDSRTALNEWKEEFGGEEVFEYPEVIPEPVPNALHSTRCSIEKIRDQLGLPIVGVFLSQGDKTFRHRLAKTKPYKGNRKAPKPVHYEVIREYMIHDWRARVFTDIEADDALASWTARGAVCASIDKDLLQVPGMHYNFVEDVVLRVSPTDGDFNLCRQIITGDATDNIPGLPRYGTAKADRILGEIHTDTPAMLQACLDLYREVIDEDPDGYFMEQASLVYLLRHQGDSFSDFCRRSEWDAPEVRT